MRPILRGGCGPCAPLWAAGCGRLAGALLRLPAGVRGDGTIVHEGESRMTAAETPDKARASPPPASPRARRESSAGSAATRPEAPGFGALPATWPPPDGGGAGPWRSALEPPPLLPLFLPAEALTTRPALSSGGRAPYAGMELGRGPPLRGAGVQEIDFFYHYQDSTGCLRQEDCQELKPRLDYRE